MEEWMQTKLELLVERSQSSENTNAFNMEFIEGFGDMANNTDMVLQGIRKTGLRTNHRIVSLDFVSMYTNIDRQQARDIIESKYDVIAKKSPF